MWMDNAEVSTYAEAKAFFAKCRNFSRGKPLRSWALLKLDMSNGDYVVHMKNWNGGDAEIGRFHPDNTFEFTLDITSARNYSVTLSQALHGAIPFVWYRKATGRYEIASVKKAVKLYNANSSDGVWRIIREISIPFRTGLRFALATNEAENAQLEEIDSVIPEKRKEWLRTLRTYKRALAVKAKMGVVDSVMAEVSEERKTTSRYDPDSIAWQRPDWFAESWNELLYTAVKNNDTSLKMIKLFVQSGYAHVYRAMTVKDFDDNVENVFRQQSVSLRRRFGVFG